MILVDVLVGSGRHVVDIEFSTARLKKDCEDVNLAWTRWGPDIAKVVMRRLVQVQAAQCLEDLPSTPPTRRHKLTGKRKGQYALDLTKGRRLILLPILPDGRPDSASDPSRITRVRIMEVTDYHD